MGGTIQTENLLDLDNKPLDGWTLLSTTVVSGTPSEIDVINLSSDYFAYKFVWYAIKPATDGVDLYIRTSSDGVSWDSTGSDYAWARHGGKIDTTPSHVVAGDNLDAQINTVIDKGAAANENADMEITLFNPSGTEYTKFIWNSIGRPSEDITGSVDPWRWIGGGIRLEAAAVNGVRFLMSSGNITSGTLWVYGIKA